MHFFNLDLHIGVIGDLKRIFSQLGHEVTDWSISGHAWVLGRKRAKVDVVNEKTWQQLSPEMCDAFYRRYKDELDRYDAFIVTHTPSFAMLYEKWNKPIICVASTRYEAPFTADPEAWERFNAYLRRQIDRGIIFPIANNKYDAAYAELFTRRPWQVIPSLCEYTNSHYTGALRESLYFAKSRCPVIIDGLLEKGQRFRNGLLNRVARKCGFSIAARGYSWQELAAFRSCVWIPYNASIMSIFEMYAAGMPMLFPSLRFAEELFADRKFTGMFSELSHNQVLGLPSGSRIPCESPDPNNYEDVAGMKWWIGKSDFYDSENLKHLVYFDSFDELGDALQSLDVGKTHAGMREHQKVRSQHAHAAWQGVLARVSAQVGQGTRDINHSRAG